MTAGAPRAVLDASRAGRFFAAFRRSRSAPGRTVTLAGFLLGTVSGSGVATTVSVGSVAWPILRRAGYPREQAGGVLAAAGIGAILSPPTLGAAAFIIAEYLRVSYLTVLVYATIPTVLYYLGVFLAIEMDARSARGGQGDHLGDAPKTDPVPLHEGARKFYG
ncbi:MULTISPECIES: TRAP transporter large permease subunit [Microbispora]|uniref:TRAP transporter large permease subunit n=1 Tax=Microbispora TaxID=2005 RepID=UPI00197B506E|nr:MULTISPECIES: TRAP transporter large permease subunit [unclassified Microbispora]